MAKVIALIAALMVGTSALAQAPAAARPESPPAAATPMAGTDCEAKAVGKDGKPLAGAAKTSFLKKCKSDAMAAAKAECETKAVGKDGKPLAGAAKASFVKKCVADTDVK